LSNCITRQHKVTLPTDEVDEQIRVFPNPANESITVIGTNDLSGDIEITDVLGSVLLVGRDVPRNVSQGIRTVNVADLPNGVYSIRIPTSKGLFQTRFIVARRFFTARVRFVKGRKTSALQ